MTWKKIPHTLGLYSASEDGAIRSEPRITLGRGGKPRKQGGRVLKQHVRRGGPYPVVSLSILGRVGQHYVHRLVAMTFVDNPDGKPWVLHKDGNPQNNSAANLRWGTRRDNDDDKIRLGECKRSALCGESSPNAKLTERDVRAVRTLRDMGYSQRTLAKMFGVSRGGIVWALDHGWKHVAKD
jgi:hypothetical protein